mmetsp:Transcript_24135/g.58620  ORF Transcript_24135/g.58620 Transcript_24135/m.58620 type:complete len:202 (-) Transcript_24135:759-1364(-)
MRDLNSCALSMTTRKPVHPKKDSGPQSRKGRGTMRPSVADIWRVRRRHSCCDLICIAAHVSTCAWYLSWASHSRLSVHILRIALTWHSQCSCPSLAFFCISGLSRTCSPERPASSALARFLLLPPAAAPALRLPDEPLRLGWSSSLSSSSSSSSSSCTRETARAAAARWGRWAGASGSGSSSALAAEASSRPSPWSSARTL